MSELWTKTDEGFCSCISDLEANLKGGIRLQSGKRFDSLSVFISSFCTPHYTDDIDHELTYWTYKATKGEIITIFND